MCTDNNAHDYDFLWTLGSNIKILDADGTSVSKNMIVGYAGSNNTQYDHRTYDTITSERNVELIPGATITTSSLVTFHHMSSEQESGDHGYEIKFIRNSLTIVGVKENQ